MIWDLCEIMPDGVKARGFSKLSKNRAHFIETPCIGTTYDNQK